MRFACYESKTWDARYDSWHCSSQLTERRVHIAWSQTRLLLLWSEQLIGGKADRQWVYGDSAPSSLCLIVCLCLSICVWVGRHLPAALKIDGGNLQRVLMMTQNWLQSWICRFFSWITHTHMHKLWSVVDWQTHFLALHHVKSVQLSLLDMWPWGLIQWTNEALTNTCTRVRPSIYTHTTEHAT